ncbi:MAG: ParB N-terminal domain-containing protein [Rectinemataceae bacterium]|jgi:hypothetical protein
MSDSKYLKLPVDKVDLDITNPRIAKFLEMYGKDITSEQMSLALGAGETSTEGNNTTFYSLRESIRTNGGIIHPIIANKQLDGRCVVIEGNTRALIYREFKKQKVEGEWDTIPCMVYDNLSQKNIDAIRLQAHLVGPRDWDPYSKAKYLDHLRNAKHLTMDQIVDFCGGRKREVLDYITAYNDMEEYYRPLVTDDQFDQSRFSAFVELQRPRVKQVVVNHKFTFTDFSKWVMDGLISPLNMVRQLPRILDNPKSRAVFLMSGAQEAMKLLEVPAIVDALRNVSLEDIAQELSRRVLGMTYAELRRLRANVAGDENAVLCDARDHLVQVCKDIAADE